MSVCCVVEGSGGGDLWMCELTKDELSNALSTGYYERFMGEIMYDRFALTCICGIECSECE